MSASMGGAMGGVPFVEQYFALLIFIKLLLNGAKKKRDKLIKLIYI
jgi:hypothetical protein